MSYLLFLNRVRQTTPNPPTPPTPSTSKSHHENASECFAGDVLVDIGVGVAVATKVGVVVGTPGDAVAVGVPGWMPVAGVGVAGGTTPVAEGNGVGAPLIVP